MPTPPNYQGLYNNGVGYAIGDTVLTDGNPYGVNGSYFIRIGNPGNPGYPPAVGGGSNSDWAPYGAKSVTGTGSITGSGDIS
jgi:hypothetical protein